MLTGAIRTDLPSSSPLRIGMPFSAASSDVRRCCPSSSRYGSPTDRAAAAAAWVSAAEGRVSTWRSVCHKSMDPVGYPLYIESRRARTFSRGQTYFLCISGSWISPSWNMRTSLPAVRAVFWMPSSRFTALAPGAWRPVRYGTRRRRPPGGASTALRACPEGAGHAGCRAQAAAAPGRSLRHGPRGGTVRILGADVPADGIRAQEAPGARAAPRPRVPRGVL